MEASASRATVTIRPAVISHVVKAAVHLAIAGLLLIPAIPSLKGTTGRPEDRMGFVLFGACLLVPVLLFLLAALRNIFAIVAPPRLEIGPDGITAHTWGSVLFLGIFLPTYRAATRRFDWSDFISANTYTHTVNLVPVLREVQLTTKKGILRIGSDHFAPSTDLVVKAVLDYIAFRELAPMRAAARVPEFQRARWKQSLRFPVPANSPWVFAVLLVCAAGVLLYAGVYSSHPFDAGDWPCLLAWLLLFVGALHLHDWWVCSRTGFVELTGEGLRVGRSESDSRMLRWDEIAFARLHTAPLLIWSDDAQVAKRIEVILNDATSVVLQMKGPKAMRRLYLLAAPPADRVAMAHELMAKGEGAEEAAVRVGLERR